MPREIITIECTEARKEGKSTSRYTTTRNKKLKTEKLELMKYNPGLRRHTLHREIKYHPLCLAKLALKSATPAARVAAVRSSKCAPNGLSRKSISPPMRSI